MGFYRGPGFTIYAEMGIARFIAPPGRVRLGVFYRGRVYEVDVLGYKDVRDVLVEYEPEDLKELVHRATMFNRGLPIQGVRLVAPVDGAAKIVLAGLNYFDHVEELGVEQPSMPDLFVKTPNSVIGPGDPIILYHGDPRSDGEVELAAVLGKPVRSVDEGEAEEAIWGYMVLNDVSSRTEQLLSGTSQWWRGKSHDTYSPIGPLIVPRTLVDPSKGLRLTLSIDGETTRRGYEKHDFQAQPASSLC